MRQKRAEAELETQLRVLRAEIDRLRTDAADAVAATHRQYRRDLVPLRQAVVHVSKFPPRSK